MGRCYGEDQNCWPTVPPRPDDPRTFSDQTGNAGKDGYTAVRRRPLAATAGDWTDRESALERDKYTGDLLYGGGMPYYLD